MIFCCWVQGYVTSDCDAAAGVYNPHHYTTTPEAAVAVTLESGMDVDCGGFVEQYLNSSLSKGVTKMQDVDTALTHLYMVQVCTACDVL